MDAQMSASEATGGTAQDLMPVLGFRNYWYPVTRSRSVGKKPISVELLGEEVVLFRAGGAKVAALADRCPHRGTKLSRGRMIFPGTLSCGYHGWTFNSKGECVAAIVEGPESRVPGQARVKAYPAEERFGVIWVYMGEGEAPPLEEDLPPSLCAPNALPEFIFWDWDCNWRYLVDNYADMCHAPFVHRTSLRMLFRQVAAWAKMWLEPLSDGKGYSVRASGGGLQAEYPGLGKFPRSLWWRVISGKRGPTPLAELRMPGFLVLGMTDPFFGVNHINVGWPVPIDANRTRYVGIIATNPKSRLGRMILKPWWHLYMKPLHLPFLGQDKRLVEAQDSRSEKLSSTDTGVVVWRNFAAKVARRPQARGQDQPGGDKSDDDRTLSAVGL